MNRTLTALPLALVLSAPAFAAPPEHGPEHAREHLEQALDTIDATPDQRSTARAMVEDAIGEMLAFHEEGRALRERVHGLFLDETIDRVALEDTRVEIVDLFDRASAAAFENLADLAEVFTVEQRKELRALREARVAQFRERFGAR